MMNIDWFNDLKDTIGWLKQIQTSIKTGQVEGLQEIQQNISLKAQFALFRLELIQEVRQRHEIGRAAEQGNKEIVSGRYFHAGYSRMALEVLQHLGVDENEVQSIHKGKRGKRGSRDSNKKEQ